MIIQEFIFHLLSSIQNCIPKSFQGHLGSFWDHFFQRNKISNSESEIKKLHFWPKIFAWNFARKFLFFRPKMSFRWKCHLATISEMKFRPKNVISRRKIFVQKFCANIFDRNFWPTIFVKNNRILNFVWITCSPNSF